VIVEEMAKVFRDNADSKVDVQVGCYEERNIATQSEHVRNGRLWYFNIRNKRVACPNCFSEEPHE
jgi:hypothetical protein